MNPFNVLLLVLGVMLVLWRLYHLHRNASNASRGSWAVITVAAFLVMLLGPGAANAATLPGDETPVGPDAQTDSLFGLDPFYVQALIGVIIPFLVAFVTDSSIAPGFKKFLTTALGAIGGIITVGMTDGGGAVISGSAVKAAILTIMSAATVYVLYLRNSKTEAKLNAVGPSIGPRAA